LKAVIDEGVPRDLVQSLRELGCDVHTFPNAWKGTKNGRLLKLVSEDGFACLITSDRNLTHQQNVARSGVAVVVLPHQFLEELEQIKDAIAAALDSVQPGSVTLVPKKS
jgi:hypothetical protein